MHINSGAYQLKSQYTILISLMANIPVTIEGGSDELEKDFLVCSEKKRLQLYQEDGPNILCSTLSVDICFYIVLEDICQNKASNNNLNVFTYLCTVYVYMYFMTLYSSCFIEAVNTFFY